MIKRKFGYGKVRYRGLKKNANRFRRASFSYDPFQNRCYLLPLDALVHRNRQTYAREVIDNGQRAQSPSIKQRI